jgi:hypothetical protein
MTQEEKNDKAIKERILKELFNTSDQKKAVEKAARESANDQRELLDKYCALIGTD